MPVASSQPRTARVAAVTTGRAATDPPSKADTLSVALLRDGDVTGDELVEALSHQLQRRRRVTDILMSRDAMPVDALYLALARHWETQVIDPHRHPPDATLIDRLGAGFCLHHALLPWRNCGGATVIATAQPEDYPRHQERLSQLFGPVVMTLTTPQAIHDAVLRQRGPELTQIAESRVPSDESCRGLVGRKLYPPLLLLGMLCSLIASVSPAALLWVLTGWTVFTLLMCSLLKVAAGFATFLNRPPAPPQTAIAHLPTVSVIVALYRESDIAPRLVRRLGKLDYPRELLDIVLAVEADDTLTRTALAGADLPPWMRIVVVPDGQIKTKPRALNFAIDHCRGSIIGVYDAEDAPDPNQINRIVERFYQRGPEVACLQGILDFYNPTTNWLSRCFSIEYATWFRIILPGLERLGLPIPLGGTTVFFRRDALERVGGWDAHNVTEDADLGMRLYRYGYRTELIDTVTGEEANCRALPWVKQRSRWLKGYMMTWCTHMRDPALLWRQLGPWQFLGFQVLFLCTLSQFLLAPVLWSFWLPFVGLPHPVLNALPPAAALGLLGLLLLTELANLTLHLVALRLAGHRFSRWWVLIMHLYFPLGALASYKAAWELVRNPFYWDKTTHGHFDPLE